MTRLVVALTFLALNYYVYHYFARGAVVPPRETFASFPLEIGGWRCSEPEHLDAKTLENLGATDYMLCNFVREGYAPVGLYVGYHATQIREEGGGSGENSIHPPAHCLPGSGWSIIDSRTVSLDLPGLPQTPARVKRLVVAKGQARQLVYYWYQSQGRVLAEDWQKILYVGLDRATRRRTDGALVRFTVPILGNDEARADETFEDFVRQVPQLLRPYLPE